MIQKVLENFENFYISKFSKNENILNDEKSGCYTGITIIGTSI